MNFKKIIYGDDYEFLYYLDYLLKCFDGFDMIDNDRMFANGAPFNIDEIVFQAEKDGLVNIEKWGVKITVMGKRHRKTGGYKRRALYKRLGYLGAIIGVVSAIIAIIAYF